MSFIYSFMEQSASSVSNFDVGSEYIPPMSPEEASTTQMKCAGDRNTSMKKPSSAAADRRASGDAEISSDSDEGHSTTNSAEASVMHPAEYSMGIPNAYMSTTAFPHDAVDNYDELGNESSLMDVGVGNVSGVKRQSSGMRVGDASRAASFAPGQSFYSLVNRGIGTSNRPATTTGCEHGGDSDDDDSVNDDFELVIGRQSSSAAPGVRSGYWLDPGMSEVANAKHHIQRNVSFQKNGLKGSVRSNSNSSHHSNGGRQGSANDGGGGRPNMRIVKGSFGQNISLDSAAFTVAKGKNHDGENAPNGGPALYYFKGGVKRMGVNEGLTRDVSLSNPFPTNTGGANNNGLAWRLTSFKTQDDMPPPPPPEVKKKKKKKSKKDKDNKDKKKKKPKKKKEEDERDNSSEDNEGPTPQTPTAKKGAPATANIPQAPRPSSGNFINGNAHGQSSNSTPNQPNRGQRCNSDVSTNSKPQNGTLKDAERRISSTEAQPRVSSAKAMNMLNNNSSNNNNSIHNNTNSNNSNNTTNKNTMRTPTANTGNQYNDCFPDKAVPTPNFPIKDADRFKAYSQGPVVSPAATVRRTTVKAKHGADEHDHGRLPPL